MKKFMSFAAFAAAVVALSGCEKDNWKKVSEGDSINFNISKVVTRTAYDEADDLQINWVSGDQVKIYCAEAEDVTEAVYSVTASEDKKNDGTLALVSAEGLKWGGDTDNHNFFAVYPANDNIVVEDGVATAKVNIHQTAELTVDASGNYVGAPDMSNAYMVANLSTTPVDDVTLHFRPIMTTLKITVQGKPASSNQSTTVTAVTVIAETDAYTSTFDYDIANSVIVKGNKKSTMTTTISLKDGEDNFIDLPAGKSLTVTAFLPSIVINSSSSVSVRVQAQNANDHKVTLGAQEIAASSKRHIILPEIDPDEVKNNNWITPLDEKIYVSQMSIPGTHDAAAWKTSGLGAGETQGKTIDEQLAMGIRAFDLRPAWRSIRNTMWLWHGITTTDISLKQALNSMKSYLQSNPGEFVFIQYRHESESILGKDTDKWNEMKNVLSGFADMIVPFKADLTIEECRGKMIMVTRNDFEGRAALGVGLVSAFPDNTYGEAAIDGNKYLVQDHYKNLGNNSSKKISDVKAMLDITARFHTDPSLVNVWALNHTSGYTAAIDLPGESLDLNLGTTSSYKENAHNVHPVIFKYLTGDEKEVGSTGIVFMDWVGEATAGRTRVYGELLPQAIIDNNYKYLLQRKN